MSLRWRPRKFDCPAQTCEKCPGTARTGASHRDKPKNRLMATGRITPSQPGTLNRGIEMRSATTRPTTMPTIAESRREVGMERVWSAMLADSRVVAKGVAMSPIAAPTMVNPKTQKTNCLGPQTSDMKLPRPHPPTARMAPPATRDRICATMLQHPSKIFSGQPPRRTKHPAPLE